jgi:hypothetical protein
VDRLLGFALGGLGFFLAVASLGAQVVALVNGRSETAIWLTAGVAIGAALYSTGFRTASRENGEQSLATLHNPRDS